MKIGAHGLAKEWVGWATAHNVTSDLLMVKKWDNLKKNTYPTSINFPRIKRKKNNLRNKSQPLRRWNFGGDKK